MKPPWSELFGSDRFESAAWQSPVGDFVDGNDATPLTICVTPERHRGWKLGLLDFGLTLFVMGWILLPLVVAVDWSCGQEVSVQPGRVNVQVLVVRLAYWSAAVVVIFGMLLALTASPRLAWLLPSGLLACLTPAILNAPRPSLEPSVQWASKKQEAARPQPRQPETGPDAAHFAGRILAIFGYGFFCGFLAYAAAQCGPTGLARCFVAHTAITLPGLLLVAIMRADDIKEGPAADGTSVLVMLLSLLLVVCFIAHLVLIGRFLAYMGQAKQ
jgi:hypothetical protein